jgi:F0F1-type ATP synthase assembly protein I
MDDTTPSHDPQEGSDGTAPPEQPSPLGPGAVAFLTLGIAGAVALVAGGAIGYLIDRWAGTSPLFTLVGLGFGVVLAVLMTVARVRKYL